MTKWLFVIFLLAATIGLLVNKVKEAVPITPIEIPVKEEPSPTPLTVPNGEVIETIFNNTDYQLLVIPIKTENNILLIPNFTNGKNAEELVTENNCRSAINGGFYREDGNPLGLFYSHGEIAGKQIQSQLITGFLWQDKDSNRNFSRNLALAPEEADFILQTGPFMIVGDYQLKLVQDEQARRSVIGKDKNNNLFLISIIEKGNHYSGPNLVDLPSIFFQPDVQKRWEFTEILNLDGGSASFFYDKGEDAELILPSITEVGSLICVR
ncbi:hypothetical protein A3J20_01985 [Candidatus Gottesmanbacteria bacterium RIFCSPLOWO2_02_FULL_42_29]|uniref:Phosphodiester glycosidase domain-containing protein n=2 Tax=Candidatus Gottesmaniibacteriota TaxID=1752720 RepID=A0A1F6BKQ3_9BACT|nr:MAG: hypothetical protein UV09_C0012G0073 [Candidatus Gottesmanbacteria bacterium GW2011_GWA2_42_18]KKS76324.1 MAG: hypothetical protein UV46_C0004G0010 [Candidatus Gottesmanbacteria bacterium GW2011_GWC2_42_8]OGG09094.1 MAG: hypothetical protein A2781_02190 [Candidatus Gottesmanbacteria bacterium RIFCSPHIGHO2_01_FULL_42_27]OGG35211.1 MAG: hypothetical protein A3G68_05945 [Candidatus Gottesmanbacteria bacterium RIFCSPLOWO2_12_FULL_42_10]OGG36754.1 MAG: hypothetical protein A3J20_01985 [Candi